MFEAKEALVGLSLRRWCGKGGKVPWTSWAGSSEGYVSREEYWGLCSLVLGQPKKWPCGDFFFSLSGLRTTTCSLARGFVWSGRCVCVKMNSTLVLREGPQKRGFGAFPRPECNFIFQGWLPVL